MTAKQYCPRAVENGGGPNSPFRPPMNGEMSWREDGTCSYCGSLNPDTFMARLEAGTVEVGPTDKSYKVYVRNAGGEPFQQTYRDCYAKGEDGQMLFDEHRQAVIKEPKCHGPDDCQHWVTREVDSTKFYFQHLSAEQRTRFIELYNAKRVKMGYPGHFYVMPFFARPATGGEA